MEGLYGESKAQTIINNCDHCLYLGGTDTRTARYFAEKFNCQVSTVLNLPLDSLFLFTRGSEPRKAVKYELTVFPGTGPLHLFPALCHLSIR